MILGLYFFKICATVNQLVGYYQCQNCGHTYKPAEEALLFGDTAVLTCSNCKKQGEHKKVLKKE